MIADIVQPVTNPEAVATLKELVCWDVNPLVVPGVLFVFTHVVTFLTGDSIVLLHLVPPAPTMEVHLLKKSILTKYFTSWGSAGPSLAKLAIDQNGTASATYLL